MEKTHDVIQIIFSPLGVAHYTTKCQGVDYKFQSMLQKVLYKNSNTDGQAWHFHGDLPLHAYDERGNLLVKSDRMEIIRSH